MSDIKKQILTLLKQRHHSHKVALEQEKDPRSKHAIDLIARIREDSRLMELIDSLPEESENHGCGVEFPHFGANYPDAKCIDGYLWDMDSYEDGIYTIGGDDPCPICNTEKWLKDVLDDEIFKTRDEALEYVKMLKSKYKHKDSLSEETSCIYDTSRLTPTPSVNIEDVARVQFASHAHVFDRKRKAVFDWEHFKEVAGIFYGFGKRDSLPEDDIPKIEGWIARNKDGSLVFCYHKPKRENSITQEWWGSCDADFRIYDDTIDEQFKDLKWEDEPREVELIFKCGVCKDSLQAQETCKENQDSFINEPKELEVAAENIYKIPFGTRAEDFIAGAEWMRSQMPMPEDTVIFMKGVAEGRRLEREDRNDDKLPRYYGD